MFTLITALTQPKEADKVKTRKGYLASVIFDLILFAMVAHYFQII